jgi:predicted deacetylase
VILAVDDVCPENLKYWKYVEEIHEEYPNLKIIAFVIANFKYEQNISHSKSFKNWYNEFKNWVEIGVHGYDHLSPPEQERTDAEYYVKKSLEILNPFLPKEFIYRPPGHQRTIKTEPVLKKLGFAGIAYQNKLKYFKGGGDYFINSHCCDYFINPVRNWRNFLKNFREE